MLKVNSIVDYKSHEMSTTLYWQCDYREKAKNDSYYPTAIAFK